MALLFRIFIIVSKLLVVTSLITPVALADALDKKLDHAIEISAAKLEQHAQRIGPERFTCYTDTDGQWIGRGLNGWCCGFSAGLMWMMYLSLIHI